MYFIGIDLSLTGTAVVVLDKKVITDPHNIVQQELLSTNSKQEIEERLMFISNSVYEICKKYEPNIINIEGLAFGARGQAMLQLAALHFMTRCLFWSVETKFNLIPPSVLKKFITGKGNAKKEMMLAYTRDKFGILIDNNNICDAYGLARLSLHDFMKENK